MTFYENFSILFRNSIKIQFFDAKNYRKSLTPSQLLTYWLGITLRVTTKSQLYESLLLE